MFRFLTNKIQNNGITANRTHESGLLSVGTIIMLSFSMFALGSCNEKVNFSQFTNNALDISQLNVDERKAYTQKLQSALMQVPQNIKKLRASDIQLVLAKPDLVRQEGGNKLWQYRANSCVMDMYWQQNDALVTLSHFEIRQRRSVLDGTQVIQDPVEWQCVHTIIQDRRRAIAQEKIKDKGNKDYAVLSLKPQNS